MKQPWTTILALTAWGARAHAQQQSHFQSQAPYSALPELHHFNGTIKRVAVIGAGVSGLQIAARLIEHNFTVRLFDRAPGPGGNWFYTEETQTREPYPDAPAGSHIKIPEELPHVEYYASGDDGKTLDERWREHWQPRPVWNSLHTNSPAVITEILEVPYPPDHTWVISNHQIQDHVRAFAAIHRLNPHDNSNPSGPHRFHDITSYATRVDKATRDVSEDGHWTLTLRKYKRLEEPDRIKAEWWQESFDAIVVATGGYDTVHVPDIPGIVEWSQVKQPGRQDKAAQVAETHSIYHSVHYRHPEKYQDKVVLIVGPGTSGSEIARDIGPYAAKIYASYRNTTPVEKQHPFQRRAIGRFPADKTEWIPEIKEFLPLQGGNSNGIKTEEFVLINGTVVTGIDEIILATGYKRLNPFLDEGLRNATQPPIWKDLTNKPEAPPRDIFNGKALRSLSWTGHFIPDPTLVFANVRPWNLGQYQSYAIAKVFEGSAFLPNEEQRWKEYLPTKFTGLWGTPPNEALIRQYVTWLNNESLKYGGRLVSPIAISEREVFAYYANQEWQKGYITNSNFTEFEELGNDEWDWYRRDEDEVWAQGLDW